MTYNLLNCQRVRNDSIRLITIGLVANFHSSKTFSGTKISILYLLVFLPIRWWFASGLPPNTSILCPYPVHSQSIESMDRVWTGYGQGMDMIGRKPLPGCIQTLRNYY